MDCGKLQEAITIYKTYLLNPDINEVGALYRLASIYRLLNDDKNFMATCMNGIQKGYGQFAEFFCLIGDYYFNKSAWQESVHWYKQADIDLPATDITTQSVFYGKRSSYIWERMSLAYNSFGRVKEAHECNEKAIGFNRDQRLIDNREAFRNTLFPGRIAKTPIRLSLGSGQMPTPSFRKTDLYIEDNEIEKFSMQEIPYQNSSVQALYSSHSLEHLSKKDAELAVKEMARVLKPYGQLQLRIPDLELTANAYLKNNGTVKEWYNDCIYGYQHKNLECPEAHFHLSGWSKETITKLLEKYGFRIDLIRNYDGWGTLSIEIFATQIKKLRICFVCHKDIKNPGFRIVPQALDTYFKKSGECETIICQQVNPTTNDIFIFFNPDLDGIRKIHDVGGYVIYHLSEEWYTPENIMAMNYSDLVICCSTALAEKTREKITSEVVVIQDAYEA